MPTTDTYNRIMEELASVQLEDLQQMIFHALRRVYPAGLTRAQLIQETAGYTPEPTENLNNNRHDRKNRAAIAAMLDMCIPVMSTSGEAGYRLDVDPEHLAEMVRELEDRRDTLNEKIGAARRTLLKVRELGRNTIPAKIPEKPVQLSIFEVHQ